jgi:peptidoglycan/LPS O-acetylase OafA/YrhL
VDFKLPGVFEAHPYAGAVNGSLWTLPWEVRMYLLLAIAWVALTAIGRRAGRDLVGPGLVAAALVATTARWVNHWVPFMGHEGPRLASMFFVGAACYVLRARIVLGHGAAAVAAAALLASALHPPTFHLVYAAAVPYLVLYLAYVPAGFVRGYNRLGDYSYGMYVYAFPVQQAIVEFVPGISVSGLVAAAFPVTLALAVASWTFVEKPMLARKA